MENKKGKKKWKRGSSPDNWVKTTLLTTKRLVLLLLAPLFSPYITWVPNPFSTTCIVSRCESRRAAIYGLWAIGQIGRWGNLIVSMDVWLLQKVLHARMEARAHVIMDLRDYFWEKEKKQVLPSLNLWGPSHLAPSWCLTVHCNHHWPAKQKIEK